MKFFLIFFAVGAAICGYFLLTDGPGSGMIYPTVIFAVLGLGTAIYNKVRNGSSLNDQAGPR